MSEGVFRSRIAGAREAPLASLLAYIERERVRREKGSHPGMMRFDDVELAVLVSVLRREVGEANGVNRLDRTLTK